MAPTTRQISTEKNHFPTGLRRGGSGPLRSQRLRKRAFFFFNTPLKIFSGRGVEIEIHGSSGQRKPRLSGGKFCPELPTSRQCSLSSTQLHNPLFIESQNTQITNYKMQNICPSYNCTTCRKIHNSAFLVLRDKIILSDTNLSFNVMVNEMRIFRSNLKLKEIKLVGLQ